MIKKGNKVKILAGKDVSSTGNVIFRKGIEVSYLSQDSNLDENLSIQQLIDSAKSRVSRLISEYEKALVLQTGDFSDKNQKKVKFMFLLLLLPGPGQKNH